MPAPITLTLDFLLNRAKRIHDQWIKWNHSDGPYAPWGGGQTKRLGDDVARTIQESVNATSDLQPDKSVLPVAPEARRVMLVLDLVGREYARWIRGASTGQDWAHPSGSVELTEAFRRLHDLLTEKKLPPPESMVLLQSMGVSHAMIAKKYGWKTAEGYPDEMKVAMVLAEGAAEFDKKFDPKTWVHPVYASIQADTDAEWAIREPRGQMFVEEQPEDERPEPPSIETMIKAKAPAQQIYNVWHKRMPELTIDYINELAKEQGIDLDGERYINPATSAVATSEAILQAERVEAGKQRAREKLTATG